MKRRSFLKSLIFAALTPIAVATCSTERIITRTVPLTLMDWARRPGKNNLMARHLVDMLSRVDPITEEFVMKEEDLN